ncbi:MAG: hypothetical protein H6718_22755 [Polyangiaceae bacterium]|nr:hypothetical protein [Polyangiaceae bacterium]
MRGVRIIVGLLGLMGLCAGLTLPAIDAEAAPAPAADAPRIAPRILLVVEGEPGALFRRLQAELEQLGFNVRAEQQGGTSLAERAGRVGANAAIRVPRARNAVEVWVADPEGDASVLKEVIVTQEPKKGGADDAVIATRAVELLRASFLEIHLEMPEPAPAEPPPADLSDAGAGSTGGAAEDAGPTDVAPSASAPAPQVPPSAKPVPAATPRDSSRQLLPLDHGKELRLVGVVAGSASPGGVPADGHIGLGLTLDFSRHVAATGMLLTPSLFSQLSGSEGSASVHMSLGLLELAWTGGTRLEPVLGAGAGVAWLITSGDPSAGFEAQSDAGVVPVGLLRAGLGWQLSDTLRAALDGRVGATASRVRVRFDSREVAEWGRPLVLLSAGIEVRLD